MAGLISPFAGARLSRVPRMLSNTPCIVTDISFLTNYIRSIRDTRAPAPRVTHDVQSANIFSFKVHKARVHQLQEFSLLKLLSGVLYILKNLPRRLHHNFITFVRADILFSCFLYTFLQQPFVNLIRKPLCAGHTH